jgi:hypothetical protein
MTVAQWKKTRFRTAYAGFDCDILDAKGNTAAGNTKLSRVRDSYLGD